MSWDRHRMVSLLSLSWFNRQSDNRTSIKNRYRCGSCIPQQQLLHCCTDSSIKESNRGYWQKHWPSVEGGPNQRDKDKFSNLANLVRTWSWFRWSSRPLSPALRKAVMASITAARRSKAPACAPCHIMANSPDTLYTARGWVGNWRETQRLILMWTLPPKGRMISQNDILRNMLQGFSPSVLYSNQKAQLQHCSSWPSLM